MNFIGLPDDILLTIIELINPLDILRLGKTCRGLYEICQERTVWTSTVRRLRKENAVFPSYSSDHPLGISALQHEATAPTRFVSLMKKGNQYGAPLLPQLKRVLVPADPDEVFDTIRLIPGGHLLVTASSYGLKIWDLDSDQPRLVMSWDLNVYDILAIGRTRDNDARVAVVAIGASTIELRIFDFSYPSCTYKIYTRPLEVWHLESIYTLSLDNFSFIRDSTLCVWNFTLNSYNQWSIPHDQYEWMDSGTHPQMILFMSRTKLYGWQPRIPNAKDRGTGPLPKITPDFALDVPHFSSGQDIIRCSLATWYGTSEYSLMYDIATKYYGDSCYTFSSYEIQLDHRGTPSWIKYISSEQLPRNPRNEDLEMQLYGYRRADNKLFKVWYEDDESPPTRLVVMFRDDPRAPTDRFQQDPCIEVDLLLPDQPGVDRTDDLFSISDENLDPSSGRLCYLINSGTFVGVVDYLKPYIA